MDTPSNSRLGPSILDADQDGLGVLKSVPLEDNDGFLPKLTITTGFLPSFQGFEAENAYFSKFPTWRKHS